MSEAITIRFADGVTDPAEVRQAPALSLRYSEGGGLGTDVQVLPSWAPRQGTGRLSFLLRALGAGDRGIIQPPLMPKSMSFLFELAKGMEGDGHPKVWRPCDEEKAVL